VQDGLLQVVACILNLLQFPRVVVLNHRAMYHILLALDLEVNVLRTSFMYVTKSITFFAVMPDSSMAALCF
jgi:hypothetical protein